MPDVDPSHDRPPAATRLPSLNDRSSLALTEGSAGATLLPPTSPYSKLTEQVAPPTGNATPPSVPPTEIRQATEPAAPADDDACRTSTEVMHRIVDGDTLPGLAKTYLGDASRYPELLEANRDVLLHPDLLPLGVRIRIPLSGAPN
jgi:nucleoid-associated protein YgaU